MRSPWFAAAARAPLGAQAFVRSGSLVRTGRRAGAVVWATIGLWLGATGCGGTSDQTRLPLRAKAPLRALDDSAWQRVGGAQADGEDELDARAGFLSAVPWPDGGLLVLDGVRLRMFGADGAERWRVGAKGRGPWEFVSLASACRIAGDTIVAFDAGTRRLSVLAADGTPVRLIEASAFGMVMPHACLRAGTVLAVSPRAAAGGQIGSAMVTALGADGSVRDSLGPLPFTSQDRVAAIIGHDDWLWSAAPWEPVLRRLRADGAVLAQYRLAEPARQLTDAEAERSRTTEAARGSGGAGRPADRRAPWFDEAVPGHAGAIWLRTFDPSDGSDAEWAGVSPDGTLIGRFTVPRSRRVMLQAVTETGVWLLRRDGDDGHAVFEFRRFVGAW